MGLLTDCQLLKLLPYDLYPVANASISDLSRIHFEYGYLPRAFAPDVLEENNRSYEERLASCKMIVSPTDTTPTVHGLLTIGVKPQDFIPGSNIQFLRIDGTQLHEEIVDEDKIEGNIGEIITRLEQKLKAHNRRAFDVTSGATHTITETYPSPSIEQIVYNAVMHRTYERTNAPIRVHWYNDHIEIISPGGPYGNVTPDNLGQPGVTDYHNPNLSATMKILGFVQAFGRGILIARNEMRRNGNPEPEFTANQSIVSCIMRARPNNNNINASAMTPLRWEIERPPKERTYPPPAEEGVIAALI